MAILQLSPLFRSLREQVETDDVMLDDAVELMVDACFLIMAKVKWLLPQSEIAEQEADVQEAAQDSGIVEEAVVPLLDQSRFLAAVSNVESLMLDSQYAYLRGNTQGFYGSSQIETAAIDPLELLDCARRLKDQVDQGEQAVVTVRKSFAEHLNWFWRTIANLGSQYKVVRFSLFTRGEKRESILNFLVLLELIKRRKVFAKQPEPFGDIIFATKPQAVRGKELS